MSQVLLVALAASIPLAALALLAAWAVEAMGADVRLRLCAWTAALVLPAMPAPAMLAIHALNIPSPFVALEPKPEPVVALVEPLADAAPAMVSAPAPKPAPRLPITALLLGLAGLGAALRLGQLAFGLHRVARLKAASEAIADPELAARLGQGVRLTDTETPVLAGLARPTILLPRRLLDGLSPEQAALVCAHERAHLAAGDHLSHLMEETMVRVFWFNPFMAAARGRLAAAREEACDARALHGCDQAGRRAYAQTLVAALRLAGPTQPVAAFTGFRRRGAERRLKAILKPSGAGSLRAAVAAVLAGIGLTAVVGGFSLAAAAESAPVVAAPLPPPPPVPPPSAADIVTGQATLPATPPPGAKPGRPHSVIVTETDVDKDGTPHRGPHGEHRHTVIVDGARVVDGDFEKLSPEDQAKVKAAMKQAHEAMEKARETMANVRLLTAEERKKIHQQVEVAMNQAHQSMGEARQAMARVRPEWVQNDGRVLMRCKVGADGKATDCVKAFPRPVIFRLERRGPNGEPLPPLPPMPPLLDDVPAPPAPPAPPGPGERG